MVLENAFRRRKRLGDILKEKKRVTEAELVSLIATSPSGTRLGELILERGLVGKEELVQALQEVLGCRYMDARFVQPEPRATALIPRTTAVRHCVMPIGIVARQLVVIMAEPQNLRILDELRFISGMDIAPRLGIRAEILLALELSRGSNEKTEAVGEAETSGLAMIELQETPEMEFFVSSTDERNQAAMEELAAEMRNEKTPAVKVVSSILAAAVAKKASDIHIEPREDSTLIRIRVDGFLRDLSIVPSELTQAVISRLKILACLDISERRAPQDGRFLVQLGKKRMDMRVSTLPTHDGEKVVIRLLDPTASRADFSELGFSEKNARIFHNLASQPQGMVLVTGPTGSGKSTTLYAALNMVNSPNLNIVTVEDPVEFRVRNINQVQINPKAGLTFSVALRAILRQDPNVILVGEVRDTETAEIALQAAQTGHLVFSSLHTNDAVSAITRLLDLKIPGFLISASVSAIIAQRLVRKLCSCKVSAPTRHEYAMRMTAAGITDIPNTMWVPAGCTLCDNTGYKGRIAIYELLPFTEQIRAAVRAGAEDQEISAIARSNGMKLLVEDGLDKVLLGLTTIEEIGRVVGFTEDRAKRCGSCKKVLGPGAQYCGSCGSLAQQQRAMAAVG